MKKFLSLLLSGIISLLLLLSGCGTYTGATNSGGHNHGSSGGSSGETPVETASTYTVSLYYDDKPYRPSTPISVQWADGFNLHQAQTDENGVARIDGLDGTYQVTLKGLPATYTYDPGAHEATSFNRKIRLDIYNYQRTSGIGSGPYSCIEVGSTGAYKVTLNSATHKVFYQFRPTTDGEYDIESWVNPGENLINPKIDVWGGQFANKFYTHTIDIGGTESTYTKNFKYSFNVDEKEIGNVFTVAVYAESRTGEYPVAVPLAIKLNGGFARDWVTHEIIVPMEDFAGKEHLIPRPTTTFKGAEDYVFGGNYQFQNEKYALNETDGWYHRVDANGEPNGPVLFAKISQNSRFLTAFTLIESMGNKALSIKTDEGSFNYKVFFEGLPGLLIDPPSLDLGPYFCTNTCNCWQRGRCIGVCRESCTRCTSDCRHLPDAIMDLIENANEENGIKVCRYDCPCTNGKSSACTIENCSNPKCKDSDKIYLPRALMGYSYFCNADGAYPVTEEVKKFLQYYSISQALFMDGNGHVELSTSNPIDALEEAQWLFACGYYV